MDFNVIKEISPPGLEPGSLGWEPSINSATGTRTRVARVRAEYPNQLDYGGLEKKYKKRWSVAKCSYMFWNAQIGWIRDVARSDSKLGHLSMYCGATTYNTLEKCANCVDMHWVNFVL